MKELPILFSTPMVKALQENRKTMTRRTAGLEKVNENPNDYYFQSLVLHATGEFTFAPILPNEIPLKDRIITCKPRYRVGDKLWVRETYFDTRKFKDCPLFYDVPDFIYKADKYAFIGEHKWKPSLFMPKEAAYIWLEVTGVRCERLQDISNKDCVSEGILSDGSNGDEYRLFINLWESINGKDSWLANPWVFVYEFKRIEKQ